MQKILQGGALACSREASKMAILCPKCGHQCDVTLFEFGNVVKCDCGARIYIDPQKGVALQEEGKEKFI